MLIRAILGLLTAAVLLAGYSGAAQESAPLYAIQLPEGAALVDAEGREAAQPGAYEMLYELDGLPEGLKLFAAGKTDEHSAGLALLDAAGNQLTDFSYQTLEYADGVILCSQDGRQGIMDTEGGILIEPLYTGLVMMGEGQYLALKTDPYDDSPDKLFLIGQDGSEKATDIRIANGLYNVSEELLPAVSAENGLYGYLNAQGQWAVAPSFAWAGAFHDGRAVANGPNGAGLIDVQGRWVIEPKCDYLSYVGGGIAVAGRGDTVSVIDAASGAAVASYKGSDIYAYPIAASAAVIMTEGDTTVVDRTGTEMFRLEGCQSFSQWTGMKDTAIAVMGDFSSADVYLYRMDGTQLAGPYRDIMPLGMANGEMYYTFTVFDTEMVEYSEYGLTFWDEVPGTRRCGVLSPSGEEMCRLETEYIFYLGEDRMVYGQEDSTIMADFTGQTIWQYEPEVVGEEK